MIRGESLRKKNRSQVTKKVVETDTSEQRSGSRPGSYNKIRINPNINLP